MTIPKVITARKLALNAGRIITRLLRIDYVIKEEIERRL